jgi:hypothetical protein
LHSPKPAHESTTRLPLPLLNAPLIHPLIRLPAPWVGALVLASSNRAPGSTCIGTSAAALATTADRQQSEGLEVPVMNANTLVNNPQPAQWLNQEKT